MAKTLQEKISDTIYKELKKNIAKQIEFCDQYSTHRWNENKQVGIISECEIPNQIVIKTEDDARRIVIWEKHTHLSMTEVNGGTVKYSNTNKGAYLDLNSIK
jgi:hypothetical protein